MARLLWWTGEDNDCCHDFRDDCGPCDDKVEFDDDCDCPDKKKFKKFRKKREKLIPIRNICVDCTPVVFRTPGQVRAVVSCPVTQVVTVPVPGGGTVPVTTTVNVPPVITPSRFRPCGCV